MAFVFHKESGLKQQYQNRKKRAKSGLLVAGAGLAALLLSSLLLTWTQVSVFSMLTFCSMVCLVAGLLFAAVELQQAGILRVGMEGEQAATDIVSRLPDTYTVFHGLQVTYEGKRSELDMVVVGPSGVYVIEVKNLNGAIRGNHEDKYWVQHKIGRRGTPYQKELYSPVRQVRTHVFRLAGVLRSAGISVFVQDGVLFTNPEADVQLLNATDRTPVFAVSDYGAEELCRYLTKPFRAVSADGCRQIVELLHTL